MVHVRQTIKLSHLYNASIPKLIRFALTPVSNLLRQLVSARSVTVLTGLKIEMPGKSWR